MKEGSRNIRLGVFVLIGTLLLVLALYFIGSKQNLFGSTFTIQAKFYNVNGLMRGNNVRFAGIDVGTVESVEILNDTAVNVTMVIEKDVQKFIRKNAVVSVGTDGLMGNKLININSSKENSEPVEQGDELKTMKPIEMDEMIRTLNMTNENVKVITSNLRNITDKINSKNSLWSLLMDTVIAENVKTSVVNIKLISNKSLSITGDLKSITQGIKDGKGSLGALITDTTLSSNIKQIIVKLDRISDTAAVVSGDLSTVVKKLNSGKGTAALLLNDTSLVGNINASMINIKNGSGNFNDNMEALKHTWPLKKYYKKKNKTTKK